MFTLCFKDFVFYPVFIFIFFSYNWPAQNDHVDYADADEVHKIYKAAYTEFPACPIYHEHMKLSDLLF